jgi:CRISPR-associated protein (TIGR03986 family)
VYSGSFVCELTTETPFFIRGMLSSTEFSSGKDSKNKPEFFSIDAGKSPRIPGSSLRGLFRHMLEIVANARLHSVSDQNAVFRAVDTTSLGQQYRQRVQHELKDKKNWLEPKVQAGYIRQCNGEWYIQPAKTINGTTWCRISHRALSQLGKLSTWPPPAVRDACHTKTDKAGRNVKTIYIQPGNYDFQEVRGGFLHIRFARAVRASATPGPGLQVAALAESGRMDSKRSEAIVFAPDTETNVNQEWLPLRRDDIDLERLYRDQVSPQQAALLGSIHGALQDMQPVFYLIEDSHLCFFGHTLMLRLPYRHSPFGLVPQNWKAEGQEDEDFVESLFGYVRRGPNKTTLAWAGRVSFTDGVYMENLPQPFENEIAPKVLSGPKTTTFQHYLEQSNPDNKEALENYDNQTDNQMTIRGHKMYWHKGAVTIRDVEEQDKDKLKHASQYTRIQAVKAGATFTFTLQFENLRQEELEALAWVMRCAANPAYRLKLGMGKPHGMGAIKVVSRLRLIDRPARYATLFDDAEGFATGELPQPDSDRVFEEAIVAFERAIAGSSEAFANQPHLRELLNMLSWPGPAREHTRYMEIEHRDRDGRKVNEYRNRRVLPTPSFVLKPRFKGDTAPPPPRSQDKDENSVRAKSMSRRDSPPAPQAQVVPPPIPDVREVVDPQAEAIAKQLQNRSLAEGDVLDAEVMRITANDYECKLSDPAGTSGKLPRDEKRLLKVGDKVKVRVKRIAFSGAAILTVKGLPKE